MKKFILAMITTLVVIVLVACGNNNGGNEPNDSNNDNQTNDENVVNNENEPENNTANLSAEEVFTKMMDANDSIESFSAIANVEQDMSFNGESMSTTTKTEMKVTMDPVAIEQKLTIDMPGEGSQDAEVFMTEEGYYMYEPTEDVWLKFPDEITKDLMEQTMLQADIETQMAQFENMKDNFSVEENDEYYILSLDVNEDDDLSDMISEMAQSALPDEFAALGEEIFEQMKIQKIAYEMYIDKSTFYVDTLDMVLHMTLHLEGEEMKLEQKTNSKYTDYNNVGEIVVPQEVIDNAQEIEF